MCVVMLLAIPVESMAAATAPTFEGIRQFLRLFAIVHAILPVGWPTSCNLQDGSSFDFIVVGAGSAGATVAARLSENPQWRVLLVEAGGDPPFTSVIPSLFPLMMHTKYDWSFVANTDPGTARAHPGGIVPYAGGKMLGGSSSINSLIYSRGRPADYREWDSYGPGWDWPTVLKYFKKSEGNQDPSVFSKSNNAHLHERNGPLLISRLHNNGHYRNIDEIIMSSYEELGMPRLLEINGLEPEGVSIPHYTFSTGGRRSSTAEAFLLPARNRSNLFIIKYSVVTRILFDKHRRAHGVEIQNNSQRKLIVYCEKEVILSAGAIKSPQLLMLSGIGPREELERTGIEVMLDLPVGRNLLDHMYVPIVSVGRKGIQSSIQLPLSLLSLNQVATPIQTSYFVTNSSVHHQDTGKDKRPQMQTFTIYMGALSHPFLYYSCRMALGYDVQLCKSLSSVAVNREVFLTLLILLHPLSSGTVTLRSRNAFDHPVINLAYYREREDLETMFQGVNLLKRFGETSYFKDVRGGTARLSVKGCENLDEDDYWRCYAVNTPSTMYHPGGTCAMGSVTDGELRVLGTRGLRVVDASVMPTLPSGNTNAPAIMIGERAADIIKVHYAREHK